MKANTTPTQLKKGDTIQLTKRDPWGKTWTESAKIVLILENKILLDNGDTLHRVELELK